MKKALSAVLVVAMAIAMNLVAQESEASFLLVDTTTFDASGTTPAGDLDGYNALWGSDVQWLAGIGDYVSWTHYFTFVPPADEILNAQLSITLYDDDADGRILNKEFGFGWGEDFTFALGEVDPGVYDYSINGSYLSDGEYHIILASLGGDFGISQSQLSIEYDACPIPEPSSLLLLSSGLLGAFIRKRKV